MLGPAVRGHEAVGCLVVAGFGVFWFWSLWARWGWVWFEIISRLVSLAAGDIPFRCRLGRRWWHWMG